MSPPIHQHQPVIGGQAFNVFIKEFGGTQKAVQDHNRVALVLAVVLEIDPGAVADLEKVVLAFDHCFLVSSQSFSVSTFAYLSS